jgi:hypothetical protein
VVEFVPKGALSQMDQQGSGEEFCQEQHGFVEIRQSLVYWDIFAVLTLDNGT